MEKRWLAVVIVSLTFCALYFDFLGIPTKAALHLIAMHVQVDDEIEALADEIKIECSDQTDHIYKKQCMVNQIRLRTPSRCSLDPTPPKPIQSPSETYNKGIGNCVDKAVFHASLFKALGFHKIYLVVQMESMMPIDGHVFTMVDCGEIITLNRISLKPITNILKI